MDSRVWMLNTAMTALAIDCIQDTSSWIGSSSLRTASVWVSRFYEMIARLWALFGPITSFQCNVQPIRENWASNPGVCLLVDFRVIRNLVQVAFAQGDIEQDMEQIHGSAELDHDRQRSQELSLAAESDTELETLLAFLDEMEPSLQNVSDGLMYPDCPESASKARASRRKKVSSTERRRKEKAMLLDTIDKLQHELHRQRNASLQQQTMRDSSPQLQNLRLRRLHTCEQNRAKAAIMLLKNLDALAKV